MRNITQNENCLTAEEIAYRFCQVSGHNLHPTNVGNAAKQLGLDNIEIDDPNTLGHAWGKKRKLYAELDTPAIFEALNRLVNRRAAFDSKW